MAQYTVDEQRLTAWTELALTEVMRRDHSKKERRTIRDRVVGDMLADVLSAFIKGGCGLYSGSH